MDEGVGAFRESVHGTTSNIQRYLDVPTPDLQHFNHRDSGELALVVDSLEDTLECDCVLHLMTRSKELRKSVWMI